MEEKTRKMIALHIQVIAFVRRSTPSKHHPLLALPHAPSDTLCCDRPACECLLFNRFRFRSLESLSVDKFLLFSASSADPAFLSAHEVSAFFCAMGRISICIVTKLFNNKLRKKTETDIRDLPINGLR